MFFLSYRIPYHDIRKSQAYFAPVPRNRGKPEPLALAVKKGNHQNNSGRTVLHYAAEYNGSPELVKLLLKRGADPKLKDNSGKTPADIARAKGNPPLAKLLSP